MAILVIGTIIVIAGSNCCYSSPDNTITAIGMLVMFLGGGIMVHYVLKD